MQKVSETLTAGGAAALLITCATGVGRLPHLHCEARTRLFQRPKAGAVAVGELHHPISLRRFHCAIVPS